MVCRANWLIIGDFIGNILAFVTPTEKGWSEVPWKVAFVPAYCDFFAKGFLFLGVTMASAQTKSILYNSCIVWSALISKYILKRTLTPQQWIGIILLIFGCSVKIDWKGFGTTSNSNVLMGMILILIGCVLHSLTNVVNEHYIRTYDFPPSKLCSIVGTISLSTYIAIYALGYIFPEQAGEGEPVHFIYRRSDLSFDTMTAETCLFFWVGFVICSGVHAVAYFSLLGKIGVVSCGVMKGLTTAGYVCLSAAAFCSIESKFCATQQTKLSAVICIAGVLCYAIATATANENTNKTKDVMTRFNSVDNLLNANIMTKNHNVDNLLNESYGSS